MDDEKKPAADDYINDGSSSYLLYLNDRESSSVLSDDFGWNHHHHLQVVQPAAEAFDGTSTTTSTTHGADFDEMFVPATSVLVDAAASAITLNDTNIPGASPLISSSSSDDDPPEKSSNTGSDGKPPPSDKSVKVKKKGPKRVRQPRYAFVTKTDIDHLEDGYRWRKYGQKAVKNSPYPRSYYRCTNTKCTVKKRVERSSEDPTIVVTTYEGHHCHHTVGFPRVSVFSNTTHRDPAAQFLDRQINMQNSALPQSPPSSLFHNPGKEYSLETPSHIHSSSQSQYRLPHDQHDQLGVPRRVIRQEPSMQQVPSSSSSTTDQGLLGDIVTAARNA